MTDELTFLSLPTCPFVDSSVYLIGIPSWSNEDVVGVRPY